MEVRRREGESLSAFLHRFSKKIRQSGIILEAKRRRYKKRSVSKRSRRLSAVYKVAKVMEREKARKMGTVPER